MAELRGRQLHTVDHRSADEFAGQHVVVVGGGHSAVQLLAEIAEVTTTTWVTRRPPVGRETPFGQRGQRRGARAHPSRRGGAGSRRAGPPRATRAPRGPANARSRLIAQAGGTSTDTEPHGARRGWRGWIDGRRGMWCSSTVPHAEPTGWACPGAGAGGVGFGTTDWAPISPASAVAECSTRRRRYAVRWGSALGPDSISPCGPWPRRSWPPATVMRGRRQRPWSWCGPARC
jgi:hypothetical protein